MMMNKTTMIGDYGLLPLRRIGGRRGQVEVEGETSYVVQVISFLHMDYQLTFNPSWSGQVQERFEKGRVGGSHIPGHNQYMLDYS